MVTSTRSLVNGFSMKSKAPRRVACMASVMVPWPEIIATGSASSIFRISAQRLEAVHAGHLDVEQDHVGRIALDRGHSVRPARRPDELVVLVLEDHPQRVADGRLVVNHEDLGLHLVISGMMI